MWAEDEARIGLQPILRRVWAPVGKRPIATTHTRYQWLYVYGFVHPQDGRTSWLLLPTVNTLVMNLALRTFHQEANPNGDKIILLLIDQAGFHTSKNLEVPPSILFFPLPPYTPELQPTECVWPLLREPVANKTFVNLDELQNTLVKRCQWLIQNPLTVQGAVAFSWILEALKQVNSS